MNWLSAILRISFVMHLNFFLSIFCLTRSPCGRTGNASSFISGKIFKPDSRFSSLVFNTPFLIICIFLWCSWVSMNMSKGNFLALHLYKKIPSYLECFLIIWQTKTTYQCGFFYVDEPKPVVKFVCRTLEIISYLFADMWQSNAQWLFATRYQSYFGFILF